MQAYLVLGKCQQSTFQVQVAVGILLPREESTSADAKLNRAYSHTLGTIKQSLLQIQNQPRVTCSDRQASMFEPVFSKRGSSSKISLIAIKSRRLTVSSSLS